jgi:hypothetical protein
MYRRRRGWSTAILREQLRPFDGLARLSHGAALRRRARPRRAIERLLVSDNYFTALGLTPALGRFLRADEVEKPGTAPVVVISYDYWRTRFAGAGGAGQSGARQRRRLAIVGVAPRGFRGTVMRLTFDFWLPATLAPTIVAGSTRAGRSRIARLHRDRAARAGASRAQAQSDVDVVMRRLAQAYPQTNPDAAGRRAAVLAVAARTATVHGDVARLPAAHHDPAAARRLRQHREPGAVAGDVASPRDERAPGPRRGTVARGQPAADREPGPGDGRRRARRRDRMVGHGTPQLDAPLRVRGIPISFETSLDSLSLAFTILLGLGCGLVFGLARRCSWRAWIRRRRCARARARRRAARCATA